jgi:hypothetical protein
MKLAVTSQHVSALAEGQGIDRLRKTPSVFRALQEPPSLSPKVKEI